MPSPWYNRIDIVLICLIMSFTRICYISFCSISDTKSLNWPCGGTLTLSVREDILDLEAAARHFEQEENILQEFEQHYRNGDDFLLLSSTFPGNENDGYIPYGKISFRLNKEISLTEDQLEHPAWSSSCQSFLCNCTGSTRSETSDASVSGLFSLKSTKSLNIIAKVRLNIFQVLPS